jgi:hypothetical protein
MRTQLTVTSPDGRQARQMVVDVDPAAPVGEVLEAMDPELSFPRSSAPSRPSAGSRVLPTTCATPPRRSVPPTTT